MMKKFLLALLLFSILPTADAWWNHTHAALMEKTCRDFDCPYEDKVGVWANIPDDVFHDNIRHVCYDESWKCPESPEGYWDCPTKFKCASRDQWTYWLNLAKNETDPESYWYNIAIASHYFYDTQNFFHRVQNEGKCHSAFEKTVDTKVKNNELYWTIETCGVEESYENLVRYVSEYNVLLEQELGLKQVHDTSFVECTFWCKLRSILSILFQ